MSLATGDLAVFARAGRGSRLAPAWRVVRWVRQRREVAVLRLVEPRLREDAGLPEWTAAARPRLARLTLPGGG